MIGAIEVYHFYKIYVSFLIICIVISLGMLISNKQEYQEVLLDLQSEGISETYRGEKTDNINRYYNIYVPAKQISVKPKVNSETSQYSYTYNNAVYEIPEEQIRKDIDNSTNYSIIVETKTGKPISRQNYIISGKEINNLYYPVPAQNQELFPVEVKYYKSIHDIGECKYMETAFIVTTIIATIAMIGGLYLLFYYKRTDRDIPVIL